MLFILLTNNMYFFLILQVFKYLLQVILTEAGETLHKKISFGDILFANV